MTTVPCFKCDHFALLALCIFSLLLIKDLLNIKLHVKMDYVHLSWLVFNQYYGVYSLMQEIDFLHTHTQITCRQIL